MNLFQSMQVFMAVAEHGTFHAAAQHMKISAPSVTRIIAALEARLNTQLLQRSTRQVRLTPAGEDYLRHVRAILEQVEEAQAAVQGEAGQLRGTLRIGCEPSLAEYWIAPLYIAFHQAFPNLDLDVHVEAYPLSNLASYDVALGVMREGVDADIIARRIRVSEGILCASPAYLERYGLPHEPQDLLHHHCLLRPSSDASGFPLRLWRQDGNLSQPPAYQAMLRPVFSINHTGSLLTMALAGAGIATFTRDMLGKHLQSGQLVHILPEWITGRFSLLGAIPSQRYLPARTKVFLDFLSRYGKSIETSDAAREDI